MRYDTMLVAIPVDEPIRYVSEY